RGTMKNGIDLTTQMSPRRGGEKSPPATVVMRHVFDPPRLTQPGNEQSYLGQQCAARGLGRSVQSPRVARSFQTPAQRTDLNRNEGCWITPPPPVTWQDRLRRHPRRGGVTP